MQFSFFRDSKPVIITDSEARCLFASPGVRGYIKEDQWLRISQIGKRVTLLTGKRSTLSYNGIDSPAMRTSVWRDGMSIDKDPGGSLARYVCPPLCPKIGTSCTGRTIGARDRHLYSHTSASSWPVPVLTSRAFYRYTLKQSLYVYTVDGRNGNDRVWIDAIAEFGRSFDEWIESAASFPYPNPLNLFDRFFTQSRFLYFNVIEKVYLIIIIYICWHYFLSCTFWILHVRNIYCHRFLSRAFLNTCNICVQRETR